MTNREVYRLLTVAQANVQRVATLGILVDGKLPNIHYATMMELARVEAQLEELRKRAAQYMLVDDLQQARDQQLPAADCAEDAASQNPNRRTEPNAPNPRP